MADNSMTMSVDGLDDLMEAFEKVVKKYPDRSGELLQTQAKLIRKEVINLVKNDTDTSGSSKRSLSKAKEYKISEIKGFGETQYIEVSGVAPHFHLLENGHQIILPRTRKNKKVKKSLSEMVERMLVLQLDITFSIERRRNEPKRCRMISKNDH